MNKNILSVLVLLVGIFSIAIIGCKKNNLAIDKNLVPPSTAKFNRLSTADTVSTYYIKSTNDPFKLAVGLTTVATVDRTIQFTYTSRTAKAGTQYNAPATLVIPAGKALDSLTISGLYSGYPTSSVIDTVDVYITGGDVAVSPYNSHQRIILRKYCNVISTDLVGTYANSTDTYNGKASSKPNYVATVSNWTPVTATSANVTLQNIGATSDNGWGPFSSSDPVITPGLSATLDWTNPANFSVTVPLQNYFNDGSGISTIKATGSFSSCDNTFTIVCTVKYTNGNSYVHTSLLRK